MTAVRELVFRGTPEMLPGRDEYADRWGLDNEADWGSFRPKWGDWRGLPHAKSCNTGAPTATFAVPHVSALHKPAIGPVRERLPPGRRGQYQALTTAWISESRCTTASGSPSVWPTWSAGIELSGMWIARRPALCAPQTSSNSRSPT